MEASKMYSTSLSGVAIHYRGVLSKGNSIPGPRHITGSDPTIVEWINPPPFAAAPGSRAPIVKGKSLLQGGQISTLADQPNGGQPSKGRIAFGYKQCVSTVECTVDADNPRNSYCQLCQDNWWQTKEQTAADVIGHMGSSY